MTSVKIAVGEKFCRSKWPSVKNAVGQKFRRSKLSSVRNADGQNGRWSKLRRSKDLEPIFSNIFQGFLYRKFKKLQF
jgi:hypothetical protein